jgi:hypothetical protein
MMKHIKLFFLLITLAIFWQGANATIIHVPSDSSTIQGAVNGAVSGDTILVAPGVYQENVDVYCKAILLTSHYLFNNDTLIVNSTIIDGGGGNALFLHGGDCFPENESLTVSGFTIRNSQYAGVWKELSPWYGEKAKSRICHNKFIDNVCGVFTLTWDECVIDQNIFINNSQTGLECYGGAAKPPGAITTVENNIFLFNPWIGASSVGASVPIFRNNIFSRNGWGIAVAYYSSLNAVGNVVCNNSIGVYCEILVAYEDSIIIKNNIITANDTGIYINGSIERRQICYNDVKSRLVNFIGCPAGSGDTTWGTNFNGTPCDSFYNIIRNPLFADTIDFALLCNSPCIDAGDSSAQVPESGGYRIDMGKNEFPYIIGDANNNYRIDVTDVILVINYLFIHGPAPCPYHSGDTNSDRIIDVRDVVCLINYLFCGFPFPCF